MELAVYHRRAYFVSISQVKSDILLWLNVYTHNVVRQLKKLKKKVFLIFSWIYFHYLNEYLAWKEASLSNIIIKILFMGKKLVYLHIKEGFIVSKNEILAV